MKEGLQPRKAFNLALAKMSAMVAELEWVRSVVADLKDGTLTWSPEWLDEIAQRFILPADATTYKHVKPSAKKETEA